MKRPTDKDLRLFGRLSEVDGDLVLDSAIPQGAAPSATERRGMRGLLARPQAVSVAIFTLLLALTAAALLITGIMNKPREVPPHGTQSSVSDTAQEPLGSDGEDVSEPGAAVVQRPTYGDAAALKKGMSVADMLAAMGDGYTKEGDRYIFTLDTGEALAVDTVGVNGGDVGAYITGFTWLGETAEAVNPMGIPADILQRVQEYAADKVIPVYEMESLFLKYVSVSLPSVTDVLRGAEVHYLCMGADGEPVVKNAEGQGLEASSKATDFSILNDLSALFDASVRIKAYYPVMTSMEPGAVYIVTSVGDYVLYLHRQHGSFSSTLLGGSAAPFLMPVTVFHRFAYWVTETCESTPDVPFPTAWVIPATAMLVLEPYCPYSEAFVKPVNPATPEAAAAVTEGMDYDAAAEALGPCLGCARAGSRSSVSNDPASILLVREPRAYGLHYWELTDGSALAVFCDERQIADTPSSDAAQFSYPVVRVFPLESADTVDSFGTPSLAVCGLLTEGMERAVAEALLGTPLKDGWSGEALYSVWEWQEDGMAHTVQVYWSTQSDTGKQTAATVEHTVRTVEETLGEIKPGISFADIVARLGPCRDGHEVDYWGGTSTQGYHFWTLPDGRILAAYVGYDIPALTDPFGVNYENHVNMSVMQILWLDSEEEIQSLGTPSLSHAQCIEAGMKPAVLIELMGEPTATVSTLASVWEWREGGKTYTCTVYLQNNLPKGLFKKFDSVTRCEIMEGTLSSLPIPDTEPTPEDAAQVTEGMTASALLQMMGSRAQRTALVDAELYCWTLTDGRVFCALAEGDVTDPLQTERVVTYTFYRASMEDVAVPSAENTNAVTEGMSFATVCALLGSEVESSLSEYHPTGEWWCAEIEFEVVTHPETNRRRAYVVSVISYYE